LTIDHIYSSGYTVIKYVIPSIAIICTTGRTEESIQKEGIATGIYLQNGTPDNLIEIPYYRKDAIVAGWTKNNCFLGMGTFEIINFFYYINLTCNY